MTTSSELIVAVNGKLLGNIENLSINQHINSFHSFRLVLDIRHVEKTEEKKESEEVVPNIASMLTEYIGKEIQIAVKSHNFEKSELSFTGTVSHFEMEKSGDGPHSNFVLFGSGLPVKMQGTPCIKAFEQMSIKDIVGEKIGLYPDVDLITNSPSYTSKLEYTVQYQESDWDFIRRLCGRYGQWFFYDGDSLHLGSLPEGDNYTLEYNASKNTNLSRFKIGLHTAPTKMEAVGWDYEADGKVSKKYADTDVSGDNPYYSTAKDASESFYTVEGMYADEQSHLLGAEATELLAETEAAKKDICSDIVKLVGTSLEPGLKPGDNVTIIETIGDDSVDYGSYIVESINHIMQDKDNYYNEFVAIPADVIAPSYDGTIPFCQNQTAKVVENYDKDGGMNRLKVKFPWSGNITSPWIRMASSSSGQDKGHSFIPEKGDEVLVNFEGGNPEKPIIVGSLYNGQAKSGVSDDKNNIKTIKTRSGLAFTFDDAKGAEKITIEDPKGNTILIDTAEESVSITGNQTIKLAAKNVIINGEDSISLESKEITINGSQKIEASSGNEISVDATSSLSLAGGNSAELSGLIVDVKGTAQANVSALLVNLNS